MHSNVKNQSDVPILLFESLANLVAASKPLLGLVMHSNVKNQSDVPTLLVPLLKSPLLGLVMHSNVKNQSDVPTLLVPLLKSLMKMNLHQFTIHFINDV
jgi:DNA-binding protein Fis